MTERTPKWAVRANNERLRSLDALVTLTPEQQQERERIVTWLATRAPTRAEADNGA
jgi:hypothetical protein